MEKSDSIIIIPTYNEKENIENIIRAVFGLEKFFHILIIEDNSPDGTATIVRKLQTEFPDRLFMIERKGKLGLGTAYIAGFKWAIEHQYDFVFEMDADFSHNPNDLPRLYNKCAVEGYDVISSIYRHCSDFGKSRIYPGIPEYINERGRGMYHYLTGSASWLLLTMLGEMYGVKGELGDLVLEPKLLPEQFDAKGKAGVDTCFADRKLCVIYENASRKGFGEYTIKSVKLDNVELALPKDIKKAVIQRSLLQSLSEGKEHVVHVELQ